MNVKRWMAGVAGLVAVAAGCRAGTVSVIGPPTATPGGTVTVSVALSADLTGVYALQGAISYDPAVLTPLSSQEATAAQGFWPGAQAPFPGETIPKDADLFRMNASQAGTVVFGYVKNPSNPAGSPSQSVPPTALRVTFSVVPGATGITVLQLSPYTVNGQNLPAVIAGAADGSPVDAAAGSPLSISLRLPGDLNGDGVVDLSDVILAVQIAGGIVPAGAGPPAVPNGDVWPAGAPDGRVSLEDATRLLRFVTGLDSSLT